MDESNDDVALIAAVDDDIMSNVQCTEAVDDVDANAGIDKILLCSSTRNHE